MDFYGNIYSEYNEDTWVSHVVSISLEKVLPSTLPWK